MNLVQSAQVLQQEYDARLEAIVKREQDVDVNVGQLVSVKEALDEREKELDDREADVTQREKYVLRSDELQDRERAAGAKEQDLKYKEVDLQKKENTLAQIQDRQVKTDAELVERRSSLDQEEATYRTSIKAEFLSSLDKNLFSNLK